MRFKPRPGEVGEVLKTVLRSPGTKFQGRLGHDDWDGETASDDEAVLLIMKHNVDQKC